jgi:hypothetical protein
MYDTMIKHYRHVFRDTVSPFHKDWKLEEHLEVLGNDQTLVEQVQHFKLAEENHCELSTTSLPFRNPANAVG